VFASAPGGTPCLIGPGCLGSGTTKRRGEGIQAGRPSPLSDVNVPALSHDRLPGDDIVVGHLLEDQAAHLVLYFPFDPSGGWRVNGHISVYTMAYALVTAREDTLKGRLREGAALVGRAHRCAWSHTTLAGLMGGSDGTELHEHFCNAIFCRRWPVDVL
jgi:hypothetical protein